MNFRVFLFPLIALAVACVEVRADVAGSLTPAQITQLKGGQMVVETKNIPGGAWPQITVYTLVNAPVATISAATSPGGR